MPGAAKKKKPLLSVAQVFNKCQEGVSGHSKYAKILWEVHEADPQQCWTDFTFCLDHLLALPEVTGAWHPVKPTLLVPPCACSGLHNCSGGHSTSVQSNVHVDRAVRFVATFAAQRPSGRQEAGDAFVEVSPEPSAVSGHVWATQQSLKKKCIRQPRGSPYKGSKAGFVCGQIRTSCGA